MARRLSEFTQQATGRGGGSTFRALTVGHRAMLPFRMLSHAAQMIGLDVEIGLWMPLRLHRLSSRLSRLLPINRPPRRFLYLGCATSPDKSSAAIFYPSATSRPSRTAPRHP